MSDIFIYLFTLSERSRDDSLLSVAEAALTAHARLLLLLLLSRLGSATAGAAGAAGGVNMAMKALRGMMNGAMSELSSAVSGNKASVSAPAAAPLTAAANREHVMAVSRDYITQPRLSESVCVCVCVSVQQYNR